MPASPTPAQPTLTCCHSDAHTAAAVVTRSLRLQPASMPKHCHGDPRVAKPTQRSHHLQCPRTRTHRHSVQHRIRRQQHVARCIVNDTTHKPRVPLALNIHTGKVTYNNWVVAALLRRSGKQTTTRDSTSRVDSTPHHGAGAIHSTTRHLIHVITKIRLLLQLHIRYRRYTVTATPSKPVTAGKTQRQGKTHDLGDIQRRASAASRHPKLLHTTPLHTRHRDDRLRLHCYKGVVVPEDAPLQQRQDNPPQQQATIRFRTAGVRSSPRPAPA